jgi:hypothetical protein
MDWDRIVKAARESFRDGVNEWISHASIKGGTVSGPNGQIPPGSLSSTVQFEPKILQALAAAGAPQPVARAVAAELWAAWKAWSDGFGMSLAGGFPTLAAVPGPAMGPTRSTPVPLSKGSSSGEARLSAKVLSANLLQALERTGQYNWAYTLRRPPTSGSEPPALIQSLADWVDSSFQDWKRLSQFAGLMGKGPVPSFAPPYVPVGPVVSGELTGGGAYGALIAGPRFGKIVL